MELNNEKIKEQIEDYLREVDDGEHKGHRLQCLINVVIKYKDGKIELIDFEVHQGECVSCAEKELQHFPLLLWE